MRTIILTGLSGSGKTYAIRYLEDLGALCVDNLPPMMIPTFLNSCKNAVLVKPLVAVSVDVRSGSLFDAYGLTKVISEVKQIGFDVETIFLEADNETLLNRYKETRREHPLSDGDLSIPESIALEKEQLQPLRETSDYLIDTTNTKPRELKRKLSDIVNLSEKPNNMKINIFSFGFKRGVPRECDLVFDVRFLPNPFYIERLCRHTGLDADVKDFVLKNPVTKEFMSRFSSLILFLLPNYIKEGKSRLVIGIGCTGGAHRSVAIAEALRSKLSEEGFESRTKHRDVDIEQARWKNT